MPEEEIMEIWIGKRQRRKRENGKGFEIWQDGFRGLKKSTYFAPWSVLRSSDELKGRWMNSILKK